MKSLGAQLDSYENFGPGFNFIRIFLAYGVLVWHTVAVARNGAAQALQSSFWPLILAILPMFFALSGFLVAGSALRLPLREYILNRSFRIMPALWVDIVFCALFLGPIFTSFSLAAYFSGREFFEYFLNFTGLIHYALPGTFLNNPYAGVVNGALWTVPYEIACYILMSAMIWTGMIRDWKYVLATAIAIVLFASLLYAVPPLLANRTLPERILALLFLSKGAALIPAFLAGAVLYLMRYRIAYSGLAAGVVVIGLCGLGLFGSPSYYSNPIFTEVAAFPLAYLVVWIGLTPIPIPAVLERGDYSYGIYLYHFPILQALQAVFGFTQWWLLAAVAWLPVILFAAFSWHFVEKPVLKMRKRFSLVGSRLAVGE